MNKKRLALPLLALATLSEAAMQADTLPYQVDGAAFEGVLVYDDAISNARPALLMAPNWLGVTPAAVEQAKLIAGSDYVIFVADLYGKAIRPGDASEARAAVGKARSDIAALRKRMQVAAEVLRTQDKAPLIAGQMGAIGFCFGGGAVLELARSGAPLSAFVSFHGNLDTPNPADAAHIKAPVLVLHGADDPAVPPAQVEGFINEMRAAKVDWQLVSYGGAVHSFTDPEANNPASNQYHPIVAKRAYQAMNNLLNEVFSAD